MAPIRTQAYLRGSTLNSNPNTSSMAIASSSRSHAGQPYIRPARGEASTDGVPDSHLAMFGPNSKVLFNSGNVSLSQHTQHTYQNQGLEGIQKLYQNSSPGAVYNSGDRYDPPKCHPNTRTGLLNMTQNWADDGSPDIMWLYGSAGAGKSAVAQTACERLHAHSNLAASFFFSRTAPVDSHRGHEGRFVTTIAYQLTESIPDLRPYVEQVIMARPSVFDLNLPEQVVALIFDPLSQLNRDKASDAHLPTPKIIVVDGLDECKEETGQKQVLEAIATLVRHHDIFPFSVFLASRPEVQISAWFASADAEHQRLFRKVALLDHCDSDHDIKLFLQEDTAKLRQSHPFRAKIPANWPPHPSLEEIVKRANGQFVYASTIMKYIKDLRHNPTSRLEGILQNVIPEEDQPYAELDALYLYILKRSKYAEFVRRLLGYLLATQSFYGRFDRERFEEHLGNFLSLPSSVDTLLIDLQSIMTCDTADSLYQTWAPKDPWFSKTPTSTIFHHASLVEFLQDPKRSQEFYINVQQFDQDITELALQQIGHSDASDRYYTTYCFLIVLQTKASRQQIYTDRIRAQLYRWDSLHEDLLYEILMSLAQRYDPFPTPESLFTIINPNLSNTFFSAVSKKRERYRQILECAGIPGQLLIIFENQVKDPGLECGVPELLEIFPDLHDCMGADAWLFHDGLPQHIYEEFDGLRWNSHLYLLSEFWDSSIQDQAESFQGEGFIRNKSFEVQDAVRFCLQQCLLLAYFLLRLDPSTEACKSKEVQAVFGYLKKIKGEDWREKAMARRLAALDSFIWKHCPLSADIVSALERISEMFFPSHIASDRDHTSIFMPTLHPALQTELLCSFSHPWFAVPRWYSSRMPFNFNCYVSRYTLKGIHNYMRLYYIRKSAAENISDTSAIPAKFVARMTIDPVTNRTKAPTDDPPRRVIRIRGVLGLIISWDPIDYY
ncbi:hypothetical protein BJ165DRAFT_1405538 [Panaeolus papilionaceus]|nr:hypothetical protein BJ165DRAFT_1405538 [Panaeolus papilionaceus]